ncbi:hypothetical protein VTK26DRAFT_6956 [Humicola hyalothermophila]
MPHRTMDEEARAAYESQSLQLRAALKKWENDWASAHGGKKPGRDDIKQNPEIAQKYKQYNKLRDMLAGKISPPPAPTSSSDAHRQHHRKRTQSDAALLPPKTPSKRSKPAETPRKAQPFQVESVPAGAHTPSAAASLNTPSLNRTLFAPVAAVPTSISPTPQKDGRVLGLFDLLAATPSGSSSAQPVPIASTPSKRRGNEPIPAPPSAATAVTPRTKRAGTGATNLLSHLDDDGNDLAALFKTPSSKRISDAKLDLTPASSSSMTTPSFLRRRPITTATTITTGSLSRVDERSGEENQDGEKENVRREDEEWKKIGPLRLPRKLVLNGRGLSSIVKGLRKMEEEAFAEDEEALREMEMEAEPPGQKGTWGAKDVAQKGAAKEPVEVGDSQVDHGLPPNKTQTGQEKGSFLLSGFDDETALYDDPDVEEQHQQSQQEPRRTFKKRGQKRTTRLVNMRPTRTKRPAQNQAGTGDDGFGEDEEDGLVPETQFDPTTTTNTVKPKPNGDDGSDFDGGSASDEDDDDDDDKEEKQEPRKNTKQGGKTKTAAAADEANGVVKRAVRKVKATAHANFKRLKLRNTGAKGGPGHNSRWRRRR